jgi:hypothetical protein
MLDFSEAAVLRGARPVVFEGLEGSATTMSGARLRRVAPARRGARGRDSQFRRAGCANPEGHWARAHRAQGRPQSPARGRHGGHDDVAMALGVASVAVAACGAVRAVTVLAPQEWGLPPRMRLPKLPWPIMRFSRRRAVIRRRTFRGVLVISPRTASIALVSVQAALSAAQPRRNGRTIPEDLRRALVKLSAAATSVAGTEIGVARLVSPTSEVTSVGRGGFTAWGHPSMRQEADCGGEAYGVQGGPVWLVLW